jgi:hypothetical protein
VHQRHELQGNLRCRAGMYRELHRGHELQRNLYHSELQHLLHQRSHLRCLVFGGFHLFN